MEQDRQEILRKNKLSFLYEEFYKKESSNCIVV